MIENNEKFEKIIAGDNDSIEKTNTFTDLFTLMFDKYKEEFDYISIIKNIDKLTKDQLIDLIFGGKPSSKNIPCLSSAKISKRSIFLSLINRIVGCEATGIKLKNGILYYYIVLFLILLNIDDDTGPENSITYENIIWIFKDISVLMTKTPNI